MHNIYNPSEVFYLWDVNRQQLSLIGDEKALIHFIARRYRKSYSLWDDGLVNNILDDFGCNINEIGKSYQIFDGMDRCINPKIYEREAYDLYLKYYKNAKPKYKPWSVKDKTYRGEFRRKPVENLIRRRGGPSCRCRKTARIRRMYANPEYKEFNRGSAREIPIWWDDQKFRCRQKSWKSHRKHQWKEKKNEFKKFD